MSIAATWHSYGARGSGLVGAINMAHLRRALLKPLLKLILKSILNPILKAMLASLWVFR